ncbi:MULTISPECIES: Cro/CI family transcriptional regulator [Pseudomonas]|uniref:Cro/CI family transcriptional regulator n=1 Tax=Pseudomonas TaxID=286 RepID=UPI001CE3F051|nr:MULTISPECIES: Cro/CI family transcriptional regulator [Pseudomonas]MDH0042434.1 Cro/CI family transcriptional regulator [Pseudomonas juntendi]MDM3889653.1 Cro/CI family transcriptional regulator [Pseudomonas juntendi]
MRRISLADFAAEKGQTKAAELLGLYQSALSKAIKSGRDIQVIENEDGSYTAEETRKFPATTKSVA